MARYPDMSVILSHAGGSVPFQAVRIARASAPSAANPGASADDMVADMRRFYFDTTLSGAHCCASGMLLADTKWGNSGCSCKPCEHIGRSVS